MRFFKVENDKIIKEVSAAGKNIFSETEFVGLTIEYLVQLHNALVSKDDQVQRFSDKPTAVKRLLAAWDAKSVLVSPRGKKPREPKIAVGRPRKSPNGTLHVTPKATGKTWHKASRRYAAFCVIEQNNGMTVTQFCDQVGADALGLLGKILETGAVELKE